MSWTSFSNLGWPAGSGPSFAQASLADEMASGMRRDHLSVTSKRSCAKLLLAKRRSLWLKPCPEAPFPLGVCQGTPRRSSAPPSGGGRGRLLLRRQCPA